MKVAEFLPPVVLEKDREKPWMDWVPGTVLFADVSGFTPMSEALSVLGAEGGEVLTDVLNRYFAAMIGIVHAHGGQVMKFGGDAILCFFPENSIPFSEGNRQQADGGGRQEEAKSPSLELGTWNLEPGRGMGGASLPRALTAARLMQDGMERFQSIKTPVKRFALKMKIGLAHGEVLLGGVGNPAVRCDYIFAGAPVDATSDAEHHAVAGEIIFAGDPSGARAAGCGMEEIEAGYYRILEVPGVEIQPPSGGLPLVPEATVPIRGTRRIEPHNPHIETAAAPYLIGEIHAMVAQGFGRHVGALLDIVPAFLRFKGFEYTPEKFDLARFHAFFATVMEITHRYGGRLNRISMGDKGSTFFLLFGAPNPLEKKEELACQWAIDLGLAAAAHFPEVALGTGMNAGRVFAGIVGGSGRSEYTVMGDAVNFAARLMQGAQDGQVCLSGSIRERAGEHYAFTALGARRFKGKAEPLEVFALENRRKGAGIAAPTTELVGRQQEARTISGSMDQARIGAPGAWIIEGEPGVGKSCLAAHLLAKAGGAGWTVVGGKGEITRRNHAYGPWKDALAALIFGENDPAAVLVNLLANESAPYLPWHLEFFGLDVPADMTVPIHDEETRKRLFQHQLCSMVLGATSRGPVLLFLDDLHWLDTLSIELLLALLNHLKDQPLFILATARPGWEKKEFEARAACRFLSLDAMEKVDVKTMAEGLLKGKVRDELVDFVFERAKGNPFFTRQTLEFLRAEDLLDVRLGEWLVKREARTGGVPGGEGLILARVGRLPAEAQSHLRMAACVGPTFSLPLLKSALGASFRKRAMDILRQSGFLQETGPMELAFPHTLVQETLYVSIPQRARRQNHRRIGSAMETAFGDRLGQYAPNLANHFSLGGLKDKASAYSLAAGKDLYARLSFPEAAHYLEKAVGYQGRSRDESSLDVLCMLANCYLRLGRPQKCIEASLILRKYARRMNNRERIILAFVLTCDAQQMSGDYMYAGKAERMLASGDALVEGQSGQLRYLVGVAYYRKGEFIKAEAHFQRLINSAGVGHSYVLNAFIPLAAIAKDRGEFARAMGIIQSGLDYADRANNPYQHFRLEIEKAGILINNRKDAEAVDLLHALIPPAESFGDYYLLAVIFLNLGYISINRRDWRNVEIHLREAINLFSGIGVRNGWAKGVMNLGIANYYQGKLEDAYNHYLEATRAFEKTNEMGEACHGYYNLAEVCMELKRMDEVHQWLDAGMQSISAKDNPALYREFLELKNKQSISL